MEKKLILSSLIRWNRTMNQHFNRHQQQNKVFVHPAAPVVCSLVVDDVETLRFAFKWPHVV
jgi:hypothetical protein